MLNRKFVMALGAAMVLAVLYGCSSSNNGLRDDLDAANAQVAEANARVAELEGQLGTATADVTRLTGELGTATADVTRLTGELGTATADVARLTGELGTATADVTRLTGELGTATADVTRLTGELGTATADVTRLTGELGTANQTAAGLQAQLTALMTPAADDAYPAESALMEAIGGTAATATDPTFDELALEISITGVETDVAIDASGTTLTVTDENTGATTTAVVYTNIEAPGDQEFGVYYAAPRGPVTTVTAGAMTGDPDILTLAGAVSASADLFNAADFSITAHSQTISFTDDPLTIDVDERELAGTFHSVRGTFQCAHATDCAAGSDVDGNLSTLGGGWTFTPDAVAEDADPHMVLGVIADAAYSWYGHWAETDDDGELTVATFSGGKEQFGATEIGLDVVHGTATYTGKAAGHYAAKTVTPHGEIATMKAGQFTADAELMASFGGDDIADNNKNEISGTITNFMDGGESIGNGWVVELEEAVVSNAVTGRTGGGTWSAEFFGKAANDPDTATVDESVITPPNFVAGSFDATFPDGEVMGAFGATKD